MTVPETLCNWCPHTRAQHDEDGFCEQTVAEGQFCDCIGFEPKVELKA